MSRPYTAVNIDDENDQNHNQREQQAAAETTENFTEDSGSAPPLNKIVRSHRKRSPYRRGGGTNSDDVNRGMGYFCGYCCAVFCVEGCCA